MPTIPIYRVQLVADSKQSVRYKTINKPESAASIIAAYLRGQDRENLVVLMLNVRKHVIGINTVSVGSLTGSIVHPREVYKPAVLANAHAIIVGHNHPSGDPRPSGADILATDTLIQAGTALQIPLLDHIIIGDGGSFQSLLELGFIPRNYDRVTGLAFLED